MQQYKGIKLILICLLLRFFLSIHALGGEVGENVYVEGRIVTTNSNPMITNPYISQQREDLIVSRQQAMESGGGNFVSSDYLIINKEVTPTYKEFILKNKPSNLTTEIQGCRRSLDTILIKEDIDNDLESFPNLSVYLEDTFKPKPHYISKYSNDNQKEEEDS
jgi:hypothetical protein